MDTTQDDFLGGRLTLTQPKTGYRAGLDPVLLAASCPARPGQRVLDAGCGVGTAGLCLAARVPGLQLFGLDAWPDYAALARANGAANGTAFTVFDGDVAAPPPELRALAFDHILMNPPFFDRGTRARDAGKAHGRAEDTPLAVWLDFAARRLAPKGRLTLIQAMARLPDALAGLDRRLGSVTVQPLAARHGRDPKLFLLHAVKGGRGAFALKAPIALHDGPRHTQDAQDYAPAIAEVLRFGAALPVFS